MNSNRVFITECPRDAMQGIHDWIPTESKIKYINSILKCGFDTIDFGSFVSPKAIPQLRDTAEVLKGLELNGSTSKLLAIVANERGAEDASHFQEIAYLGYPFSISETFQQRNTNATIQESLSRVEAIHNLCVRSKQELVVYISMGFGNPYGDAWSPDLVAHWSEILHTKIGINRLALSDTIGSSTPELTKSIFETSIPALPNVVFGAHLHTSHENASGLVQAAYGAGCRHFDGAIKGYGGCPMASDELTGNMPTEIMLHWMKENSIGTGVDAEAFGKAVRESSFVFN